MTEFPIRVETTATNSIRSVIRDAEVEVQVGLHPWERHPDRPTRLLVSVEMTAPLPPGRPAADIYIDYDPIRAALRDWPARPHTELLETLADELVALCFANPLVASCRVSLMKPDIFNNVAAAGIEVIRTRPAR